jgi:branched-chain amino acid transport system substrate-binding protein
MARSAWSGPARVHRRSRGSVTGSGVGITHRDSSVPPDHGLTLWRRSVLSVLLMALVVGTAVHARTPLTVAVVGPFSGFESFIGPNTLAGVKVAVDLINADGGVLDKEVRIATGDTSGDALEVVPALQKAVRVDHASGVIGPTSVTLQAALPYIASLDIVAVLSGGTTFVDRNALPNLFRTTPSDSLMGVAMAYYAYTEGHRRAALVFGTNASAQTLTSPVADTFTALGGKVVERVGLSPGQASYRSEILKIYGARPDVVFFQLDPTTGGTYFDEVSQLEGPFVPYVGTDVTASADFIHAVGVKTASSMIVSIQGRSVGGSGATAFAAAYRRVIGGDPVVLANYGYDAMNVLALAWTKARATHGDLVFQAMHDVAAPPGTPCDTYASCKALLLAGKEINYEGASGSVDFNRYGNVASEFEAVKAGPHGEPQVVYTIDAKAIAPFVK